MEEQLKYLFTIVSDQQKFAEGKNAGLIAFDTAGAAAILSFLASRQGLPFGWRIALLSAIGLLVASCVLAIISFVPKLDHFKLMDDHGNGNPADRDNLYYFAHLRKYSRTELVESLSRHYGFEGPQSDRQCLDLAAQVIVNSRIASAKYRCFRWGSLLAIAALVLLLITFVLQPLFVQNLWS